MIEHTVNSYDRELELLNQSVVELGKVVGEILMIARNSLTSPVSDHVEDAKRTDQQINALDAQIETKCVTILALRQPMAIDLRIVIAALKLAVIMERMGDLAKNSIKRTVTLDQVPAKFIEKIIKMIDISYQMLEGVLSSYSKLDNVGALKICESDDEIDEIYATLNKEIQDYMQIHADSIPSMMQFNYAVRNVERIGDYVTKVAKILDYVVTGDKTPKLKKKQ